MKTGALIRFACEAGAILGGAAPAQRQALVPYGEAPGLAFQIADDLLDMHGDATAMGKAARKDAGKATLVSVLGAACRQGTASRARGAGDCGFDPIRPGGRHPA